MLSTETIKRALGRMLEGGLVGALMAFVAIPINLEDPKKYVAILAIGMGTGFIMGLKKAITGYLKYDR